MAFNLAKFADLQQAPQELTDIAEDQAALQEDSLDKANMGEFGNVPAGESNQVADVSMKVDNAARQFAAQEVAVHLQGLMEQIKSNNASVAGTMLADPHFQRLMQQVNTFNPESLGLTPEEMSQAREHAQSVVDYRPLVSRFENAARSIQESLEQQRVLRRQRDQKVGPMKGLAFNLRRLKTAQVGQPEVNQREKGEFVATYLDRLLRYDGQKGENDAISFQARQEIIDMASPLLENDATDAVERVQSLTDREQASKFLEQIYDNFVAPAAASAKTQMEPVMSENKPKGIIKFSLSDQVLNNKQAGMEKTAIRSENYMLYGPSEKRVCPKLRGKNMSVGDVVSEYVCRHHCLDGIVLDDERTVCGEALWRANVMDKFSREYVDKDGKTVGGYLNKRFEINRNVPEENKMRLKPGENRKPRPPEWGSLESRMQAMRAKEGQDRGYSPTTNTSKPFNWATDVDNNGMKEVRTEGEVYKNNDPVNKPKVAFNLSHVKTAQSIPPEWTKYYTVDEAIETLPLSHPFDWKSPEGQAQSKRIEQELLTLMPNAYNYDSSVNEHGEFRETPPEPDAYPEFKLFKVWDRLSPQTQQVLDAGYKKEHAGLFDDDPDDRGGGGMSPDMGSPDGGNMGDGLSSFLSNPKPIKAFNLGRLSKTAQAKPMPGNPSEQIPYDFTAGESKWKAAKDEELLFAYKDLKKVIEIQEQSNREGGHVPKLGYYHDELHTVIKEMNARGIYPGQSKDLAAPTPVDDGRPSDADVFNTETSEDKRMSDAEIDWNSVANDREVADLQRNVFSSAWWMSNEQQQDRGWKVTFSDSKKKS